MPKSVIREIDNSTAGSTLSSNFAVLVPGYINPTYNTSELKNKAKLAGIYIEDSDTYVLNSVKQFKEYIGKFGGFAEDVAPDVTLLYPVEEEAADNVDYYRKHLKVSEFRNLEKRNYKYYTGTTVAQTDPDFGKNKHLVKTFVFSIIPEGETDPVTVRETYKFVEVSEDNLWDDLPTQEESEESSQDEIVYGETEGVYFKIYKGHEGTDKNSTDHIGNQMAYELLNLGYTVYFKLLNGTGTATEQLSNDLWWEPLKQKSVYRIRYLTTGGCYDPNAISAMQKVAEFRNDADIDEADTHGYEMGRGDVIALADINEETNDIVNATTKEALLKAFGTAAGNLAKNPNASKYTAIFAPRVVYDFGYPEDDVYSSDVKFPCSFHYLACAAQAQQRYAEWYAVAGYQRGICSLPIKYTTYTFGDIDINTLAPRKANTFTDTAINLILTERGSYYLWGNRTAYLLDSSGLIFSHFLNIRQLCTTIKQVLYVATRQFTFEPNSDLLWINFVNAIRPTLEAMKADQGISGYKITRVETKKKALLVARIRIVPIEALEDFDISIYLEDSLSGIVLNADEEEAAE